MGIYLSSDLVRKQQAEQQVKQIEQAKKDKNKENVAGTAGFLTGKAVKGGTGFFEGIADLGAAALKGVGVASSWAANNAVGKAIFGKDAGNYENNPLYQIGSQMQQDEVAGTVGNVVNKELQPYSYAKEGGLASSVAEGIGFVGANVLTAGAMGAAGKGGKYAPMFTSTTGNEFTQSTNDGNSTGKSLLYAAGRGAIETGSEMLFGGIGKVFGKGALDDVVVGSITKRIKSTVGKKLAEVGIKAVGEGLEENVSGLLTPILQRMTIDPNAKMYWQNKDGKLDLTQAGLDLVVGGITSAIMQTPSAIGDIRGNNKNLNTLKSINQQLSSGTLNQEQAGILNEIKPSLTGALQNQNFTNEQIEQKTQPKPITPATQAVIPATNNVVAPIETVQQVDNTGKQVDNAGKQATFEQVVDEDLFNIKMEEVNNQFDKESYNLNEDDGTEYEINGTNFKLNNDNILEITTPYTYNKKNLDRIYENKIEFAIVDQDGNEIDNYTIEGKDNNFTKADIINAVKHITYDDSNKVLDGQIDIFNNVHRNTEIESQQIIPTEPTNLAAAKEEDVLMVKSTDPTKAKSYNTKEEIQALETKKSRYEKVRQYRSEAKSLVSNIATWKDKSMGFKYSRETMERNIYDIIPDKKEAKRIIDEYFTSITERNAQIERFINSYNERIKALNLTHKESVAVQMWGEYRYNPDTTITQETMTDYIKKNNIDVKKMENAVETFRGIYDELIVKANQVLKEQGYKEIPYRKGYFPHFTDEKATTILGKVAEKLGWVKRAPELPTSIAGMTDIFKPGKTWFGNALQRKGDITDYNALKGFDNYIRGVGDIIFHTESIQKLRALENEIRYQYSEKGIQEEIDAIKDNDDLEIEQQEELIDNVFKRTANPMPNLVTELRKYTDSIANKKDIGDRAMEQQFGRGVYTVAKNIQKRLGANMVGLNISSALTNFIPITQAYSQIGSKNMLGATAQTLKTIFNDDGFADKSTFLTNRVRQADTLYKTGLDKASDKASFLFFEIDNVVANVVVRGKYAENLQKGMNEIDAMKDADQFAKNVIGGRDKGSMPTIFNKQNPFVKLVTTFQYEVNNQYSYMFKDLPKDMKDEGIARLTMAFIKMFMAAWLYNKGKEAVTGTKSAFSPFDIVEETIKTMGNDSLSLLSKGKQITTSVAREVPFIGGLLGGGRLPIEAALPSLSSIDYAIKMISEESDEAKKTAANNLKKELLKPVFYLVPPFGGGQVKKTIEGLSMFDDKKAVSGSYTASGKLRFPVEKTTGNVIQAALFGQYASKEAREYFDNERRMLSDNQLKELSKSDNIKRDYELLMNTRELNRLKTQRKQLIKEGKSTTEIEKKIDDLLKKGK